MPDHGNVAQGGMHVDADEDVERMSDNNQDPTSLPENDAISVVTVPPIRHMNFREETLYPRFFRALRAAFATDYNIRGIVAFKDRRLRWKQRLAFNDQCVFP